MSGHRPGAGLFSLGAAAAALAAYGMVVRPRVLTWGATGEEASRSYLGDRAVAEWLR